MDQYSSPLLPNSPQDELTSSLEHKSSTKNATFILPISDLSIAPNSQQAGAVVAKIEDIFEDITDCILGREKEMTILMKTRLKRPNTSSQTRDHQGTSDTISTGRVKSIKFPSKSVAECRRFTALLTVLSASHEALITGVTTTKREIYYRDPNLFLKQNLVDRCVDDIAYTLVVQRDALNVVGAAKGLIAGSLTVHMSEDVVIDYSTATDGFLIPNVKLIQKFVPNNLKWVLVIEKEATFRALASSKYWETSRVGLGLLITAKGYPDLQTRQFLHHFSVSHPQIPIFALVDFDADGIGIMSTYKYGSINLAHEINTTVSSLQWLGPQLRDVLQLNKKKTQAKDPQGLLQLTARDRRIAVKLLEKEDLFGEGCKEAEWRREIQKMLMLNVKAEIQVLGSGEALEKWLNTKLRSGKAAFKKSL